MVLLEGNCEYGTFPPTKSAFVFKSKTPPSAVNALFGVPVGVLNPFEFVIPFNDFSNVHTEKIDFQAYYGSSAGTNTFRLVGAKPISEEDHNKITGAKR